MRIYLIMAGIVLLLSTVLYFSLSATFKAKAELRVTKVSLNEAIARNRGLEAFTESLQLQVVEVHKKSGSSRQGVENALLKEKEWAASASPVDVANELCTRLNCGPAKAH